MKIIFAAAGSAGHIEPALAVADAWRLNNPDSKICFVGTHSGLENKLIDQNLYQLRQIPKVTLPRQIRASTFMAPFHFLQALLQSLQIVKGANLVIGFGGYVCGPIYLAATIKRIPFIVHEANAIPGWANKFGAALGGKLVVGKKISLGKFKEAQLVGLPLKSSIKVAYEEALANWPAARLNAKTELALSLTKPVLLIMGGSQGSVAINKIIAESIVGLTKNYDVLHSLGANNELPLTAAGYYPVSYISDMATAYLAADVILARSGAITCAEVNALGKYAIFIPLNIGNGEQARNADFLVTQHRAEVIRQSDFTAKWLTENLPSALQKASQFNAGDGSDLDAVSKIQELMQQHARIR